MSHAITILDAIADRDSFGGWLGSLDSWGPWCSALRCLYGLRLGAEDRRLIRHCTGRQHLRFLPPAPGFTEAIFAIGRRCGKSRAAAMIATFESVFAGHETRLAPGELGMVLCISPTKDQSAIVLNYLKALFRTPLLRPEVVRELADGLELRNGLRVAIVAGDHKHLRGYSIVCAICDELAFFMLSDECRIKSDTELWRALRPSVAVAKGRLIGITSPYARKGFVYRQYKRCWGNDRAGLLFWNCASSVMNPTLPQSVVDEAMAEDRAAALSEFGGQFRDDVTAFLPREVIESLVVKGRLELPPSHNVRPVAFIDVSGGRADSAALAVAWRRDGRAVLGLLREFRPPFDPLDVTRQMGRELRRYGLNSAFGDAYGAEWVRQAFARLQLNYLPSPYSKSEVYLNALPLLASPGASELLDNERLIDQLAALERRTRAGGRDVIDHPQGGRDDLANAACGALALASRPTVEVGAFGRPGSSCGNRALDFVRGLEARGAVPGSLRVLGAIELHR